MSEKLETWNFDFSKMTEEELIKFYEWFYNNLANIKYQLNVRKAAKRRYAASNVSSKD